ncbi:MAG: 30S ribosomal protein S17 [Legionellales bacterium RIFCSPHIGHO2_12_FULL_37_14]|nr:MAG: 30S ribosomal protein S17 [Legionellales bacterium RIFCSPHIGHO2_12_FULL_37_14]
MVEAVKTPRIQVGKVVSDKMDKTIVVYIERTVRHPKYGKILKRKTKIQAHDEDQVSKVGDTVRICQTRPISKNKSWKLVEVISS